MAKASLSPGLQRGLYRSFEDDVLILPQCRQLGERLRRQGMQIEEISLIDALAARASNRRIARLSVRRDVGYIQENSNIRVLMDIARGTVGMDEDYPFTGRGVTICILDTGIEPHPDFTGRIAAFVDLIDEKQDPYDDHGHGTMCAGCAAGSGLLSGGLYRGIAPEATLVSVKAMNNQGDGSLITVLRGMQWVAENRRRYNIRVLSLSLGVDAFEAFDPLAKAADALWSLGIVVVAAAGNSGPREGTINSPGRAASIITVAAMDDRNHQVSIPSFSSRGPVKGASKPDLCAPGVRLTTTEGPGYGLFTGTSASAPIVAGCAAQLLEQHPDWTPDRVKQALLQSARPIGGTRDEEGAGVVQVAGSAGFDY